LQSIYAVTDASTQVVKLSSEEEERPEIYNLSGQIKRFGANFVLTTSYDRLGHGCVHRPFCILDFGHPQGQQLLAANNMASHGT
jgi:hypothetical protein